MNDRLKNIGDLGDAGSFYRCRLQILVNLSRPDSCSVDFGRETPKFRFEFCCGFLGGFFPPNFPRKRAPKNPPKNPPQNSPGNLFRKIPLGLLQKPSLENCLVNMSIGMVMSNHQRVSGFPETPEEVWGTSRDVRRTSGELSGSLGNFWGTSGLLLPSVPKLLHYSTLFLDN